MQTSAANPTVTPLLRLLTLVEVIVLLGGGAVLFFFPDFARAQWPWEPAPFNMRFLGAIYLASVPAVTFLFTLRRWMPARIVVPAIFVFTTIVAIVSLLNAGVFDFQRWGTWVWFALYIILPINSAYHLWLYRRLPPADSTPTPTLWRAYLLAVTIVLGVYGIGLILAPALFTGFWPWRIDDFHSQVYSAAFITGGVGAFAVSRVAAPTEFLIAALTQGVFSLFSILGLIVVDAAVHRVDWSLPGTWLWVGAFALMLIASIGMILRSRAIGRAA